MPALATSESLRQHRTRLRDIANEELIAGLCYINQYKDTILATFQAYDPEWTNKPNCAYAKCLKHLAAVRSTELAEILRGQEKKRRNISRKGDLNVKVSRQDEKVMTPSSAPATDLAPTVDNDDTKELYPCLTSYNIQKGWRGKTTSGTCGFLDALFHPESP